MTRVFRCKFELFQNGFEDDEEAFELEETFAEDFIFDLYYFSFGVEKIFFVQFPLHSGLEN